MSGALPQDLPTGLWIGNDERPAASGDTIDVVDPATGKVVGKAFAYFLTFSTLALIVGLVVANVVRPGAGMNIDPATLDAAAVATYAAKTHDATLVGFLMNIIPETVVGAFAGGEILQVLFFSVLFGISLAIIGERAQPVMTVLESLSDAMFKLVAILMKAAPIGAFGAFAFTIGKYGIGSIANLEIGRAHV